MGDYLFRFRCMIAVCIATVFAVAFLSTQSRTSFFPKVPSLPQLHKVHVATLSYWEDVTHNDPKLSDIRTLASSRRSELLIVNRKKSYFVGDVVDVLVIVRDGTGQRKTRGGDEVRIWSRGPGLTGSLGAVTDVGDGTYRGRVKLFWAGSTTIKAGVFTPREGVAFLFKIVKAAITQFVFAGNFSDGSGSEQVRCTASIDTALRFTGHCDLTLRNHGLPWFCARPKHIPCSNWSLHVPTSIPLQASSVEKQMMKSMTLRPTMNIINIKPNKGLKPRGSNSRLQSNLSSSVPCTKVPANLTWHVRSPVGYAYSGKWFSSFCSSDYSLSVNPTSQCLSGRRFWFLGDSTTRQLYVYLMKALKLQQTTAEWTNPKSYNFSIAEDKLRTFSIAYSVHGLPFGYGGRRVRPSQLVATHAYIDSIAAGSKDIVLVHYYTHFQTMHPDVIRPTLRKTVEAIQRLHQRAPDVMFLIKGPHAFQSNLRSIHVNDFWGNVLGDIFREEFVAVQDYVVYLDLWDLTAAMENVDIHPKNDVLKMTVNYMLSFTCPNLR